MSRRAERASGPEKFRQSIKKDFFDSIGQTEKSGCSTGRSALPSTTEHCQPSLSGPKSARTGPSLPGFLAITSNAWHAERSNDRCPVLPTGPGLLARRFPRDRRHDRGAPGTTPGVARSVSADCPFRTHAHVLVRSIQYWPSVRYCGMNCPTDRRVPSTMISALTKLGGQPRTRHRWNVPEKPEGAP